MALHDSLGDRMKRQYEHRSRTMLPRRTNVIVRLDGRCFHTYTAKRARPWDALLHHHLVEAAAELCRDASGAQLAFVQSDEISLWLADYASIETEAWFDNNLQKIVSVSSSIVTAVFNTMDEAFSRANDYAYFDARAFSIPDPVEVHNYFVWRQQDVERNSLSVLAQQHYAHDELLGKKKEALHDLLHAKGVNWNDMPDAFKRGTVVVKEGRTYGAHPAPIFTQDSVVYGLLNTLPAPATMGTGRPPQCPVHHVPFEILMRWRGPTSPSAPTFYCPQCEGSSV